jgi:hypothetical protein
MFQRLRILMFVGLGVFCLSSCARIAIESKSPFYQTLEFGNDGSEKVTGINVRYGERDFPSWTASSELPPNHRVMKSESGNFVLPDFAEIVWIAADGKSHRATAPIRSFVHDPSCFHGFRFFFVDHHIDIYLITRRYDCSKMIDVAREKVFSSANETN